MNNIEIAQQAFEDLIGEVEAMRNAITHPNGRRSYFIDSQDQIRVDELTAVLDKACAAREAISALSGDGMVMVPREPTEEMIASGWRGFQGSGRGTTAIWHAYRAMIAASPALTNDKEG